MTVVVLQAGKEGNRSAGCGLWLLTNSCSNVVKSIDVVAATPLLGSLFPMTAIDWVNLGATQQPAVQTEFGRTIPPGAGKYSICEQ